MGEIKLSGYICERCKHTWIPRVLNSSLKKRPLVCPLCKSPYWDIPKKKRNKEEGSHG